MLRPMHRRELSGMAKPEALLLLLAVAIFLAGAVRYVRLGNFSLGHFSLAQAAYCLVSIPASLLLLLIFDYVVHHARIVAVAMLFFTLALLITNPAFCVGMGLALAGMVVVQRRGA
jgi:hypothetical protein